MAQQLPVHQIYNPGMQTPEALMAGFVVRKGEFAKILQSVQAGKLTHFIVEGQRGMGKTTLLLRLKYEVGKDPQLSAQWLAVAFKEEEYGIGNLPDFWHTTAEYLKEEYPQDFEGLAAAMQNTWSQANAGELCYKLLTEALEKAQKKLLLLVDNLGDILNRFDAGEVDDFKNLLLSTKHFSLLAASSYVMEDFFEKGKTFYQYFTSVRLSGINKEDTIVLLRKLGESYKEEAIEKIIKDAPQRIEILRRLTGGVPRTIVLLYEIFIDQQQGSAFSYLEQIIDRVTPLYKHKMDELPPQQQKIIHAIALQWDAVSTRDLAEYTRLESKVISAQLRQLEKNGWVEKIHTDTKNHLYHVAERFFNIWYLMRVGKRGGEQKVKWLVRFFEIWCDSEEETRQRVMKHLEALQSEDYHPRAAYFITEALARVKGIDIALQHELIKGTRIFLEKTDTWLAKDLSASDIELFEKTINFYEEGEIEKCLKYLLQITGKSAKVLLVIGYFLEALGKFDQAETYYLQSAEKGNIDVLLNLGNLYRNHFEDYLKAESYYLQSAEKGNHKALLNLGNLYVNHFEDYLKAEAYYLQAAEKGDVEALLNLGYLYNVHFKDYLKAEMYYLQAAEKGSDKALFNLAYLYDNHFKDYLKAEAYYLQAVEQGEHKALLNLGYLYDNHFKDYLKAEAYYLQATEQGEHKALFNLGYLYDDHFKDYLKAEAYYLQASEKGNVDALFNLGYLYDNHFKNYLKAAQYYLLAIEKGDIDADDALAWMFYQQKMQKEDALQHALQAVEKNKNIYATHTLATVYLWHNQIENSIRTAKEFLYENKALEEFPEDVVNYLMLLIAKKQFAFAYEYFQTEGLQLKDRFKPLYYALMYFMQDKYPNEYRKMGSELRETVEEIIAKIKQMEIDYA